jgi:hypothetical protein
MRSPTKDEFEEAFGVFGKEQDADLMYKAVGAMLRDAKLSTSAMPAALGLAPTLLRTITAGGADYMPILKVLLMGWYLGQQFAERNPADPPINTDDMDRFFKSLDADVKEE